MSWYENGYLAYLLLLYFTFIAVGMKWQLSLKIVITWTTLMAVLGVFALCVFQVKYPEIAGTFKIAIGFLGCLLITAGCLLLNFFRDPERASPAGEGLILSPADGRIVYVKQISSGVFPFAVKKGREITLKEFVGEQPFAQDGIQVGITMNLLNVHVNRVPISGRVLSIRRVSGVYHSLRKIESLLENERVTTVIGNGVIKVGVVQIASRLVRRIVTYQIKDQEVEAGQRMGAILLGSQVDLLIPSLGSLKVFVQPDQEVIAGVTILARY